MNWKREEYDWDGEIRHAWKCDTPIGEIVADYGDWLDAMLSGAVTQFYEPLRWPGWEAEVAGVALDQGISTVPPPWTAEGKDLAVVSRRPIRLGELVEVHQEMARQLGFI